MLLLYSPLETETDDAHDDDADDGPHIVVKNGHPTPASPLPTAQFSPSSGSNAFVCPVPLRIARRSRAGKKYENASDSLLKVHYAGMQVCTSCRAIVPWDVGRRVYKTSQDKACHIRPARRVGTTKLPARKMQPHPISCKRMARSYSIGGAVVHLAEAKVRGRTTVAICVHPKCQLVDAGDNLTHGIERCKRIQCASKRDARGFCFFAHSFVWMEQSATSANSTSTTAI